MWATAAGTLAAVTCLVLFRQAVLPTRPVVLAAIVIVTTLLAATTLAAAIFRRAVTAALLCAGLLAILAGGLANWLHSLQGFVILTELEAVPLHGGSHLQEFETGALSNPAEMNLTLQLEDLRLVPASDGFLPASRLRLIEKGSEPRVVEISRGKSATIGTLRFHQGAFGFAPRIVITKNGEAVFDRHVPFTTAARDDGRTLSFDGALTIEKERLAVRGAISLESLDDELRGHPRLGLRVERDGRPFGQGELEVGHFAKLQDGYAIGFAGMKKWSEIDISRRNYPEPILAGAGLMLVGLGLWPFTRRAR